MKGRKDVGPLEVVCNAPHYPLVEACTSEIVGLHKPWDVPWEQGAPITCDRCKKKLRHSKCKFDYASGEWVKLMVTQCECCFKIWWVCTERSHI